jgi:hypothetical protein
MSLSSVDVNISPGKLRDRFSRSAGTWQMASVYKAWSQEFLGDGDRDLYTVFLEDVAWRQLHDRLPDAKRIFAVIRAGDRSHVCALGHPVRGGLRDGDDEPVYVPPWMLQTLRIEGAGDIVEVEWIPEEFAPEATKIVLRPHESAFYHADAREELEPVLTRYGILQVGTTIPVPLEVLGGYVVLFDVVACEPADLVLMEGDEVELEFEKALDYVEPVAAAAAPSAPAPQEEPFGTEEMLPPAPPAAAAAPQQLGHILGGVNRPRLPDGRPWNPYRV